jgi:uncharacterized membrane protein HdeD (DUF308 family)
MGTSGVCSVSLAILMMLVPRADAAPVVYLIAAYGIVFGVLTMSAAARFRDEVSDARRALRGAVPAAKELSR